MGVVEILAAIDEAAREEQSRVLQDARAEAQRLLEDAKSDVDAVHARSHAEAASAAQALRSQLHASVSLEISRMKARARDDFVFRAFSAATDALREVRAAANYPSTVAALAYEAIEYFPPEQQLWLRHDPRDTALVAAIFQDSPRVTLDGRLSCWGGVIVLDATARVVVDNTVERRMERAREVLWREVAALQPSAMAQPAAGAGARA